MTDYNYVGLIEPTQKKGGFYEQITPKNVSIGFAVLFVICFVIYFSLGKQEPFGFLAVLFGIIGFIAFSINQLSSKAEY